MDIPTLPPTPRHDGWTAARKAQFLDDLAGHGNVQAACARVGLSREAAYRLRRRDELFARAWAAALVLGREASAEVLGCRALEGVEEEIWYRGEVVGTRRRYDNRLLLAHVARLDRLAEGNAEANKDAARFDELLARLAGLDLPDALESHDGELPLARHDCVELAAYQAEFEVRLAAEEEAGRAADNHELPNLEEVAEAVDRQRVEARRTARQETGQAWDAWLLSAHSTVDGLLNPACADLSVSAVRGLSTVSTSPPSPPPACGRS